jgi:hypothetical protein
MLQNDAYINYFRWQCANHPDLLHSDEAGSRIFEVIDIDEALGDFRSGVKEKDFIFRLIMYTYSPRLVDNNFKKQLQGGFIIAKNFSPRKSNHLEASRAAEEITDHFIAKMISDSANGHSLWMHSLDDGSDISVVPVLLTGDGAYAGWRVIFSFENFFDHCVPGASAPEWLDEGVTPEIYEQEPEPDPEEEETP